MILSMDSKLTESQSMEMLRMDRKIKRNITRLLQVEAAGLGGWGWGGEGGGTVYVYKKNIKMKQKAD